VADTRNELLRRAYTLNGLAETEALYDDWADSYDTDTVEGMDYVAPGIAAARLLDLAPTARTVLDAGCGTGLAGAALTQQSPDGGSLAIDGLDLSQGMLAKARERGVYRTLRRADLTTTLAIGDGSYDAVLCVGTFTSGHVGPAALEELTRITRPGGVLVATVHENVWESWRFPQHLDGMVERGLARIEEISRQPYHQREGLFCRLLVLRTG
jgi:SAM-dependent methyltransferase